ncbi:hypothetical protein BH11PLA2_BH11PLA2_25070 [soil metagenome]
MFNSLPAWVVMWVMALGIYAACKTLTWLTSSVPTAPLGQQTAYLFAWPGMDANAFLSPRRTSLPRWSEWYFAVAKLILGIVLLWFATPLVPADAPLLRGWLGMVGLTFVLHFGLFHLLSCFWRGCGIDAKPLMCWPILATSLADFWGRRWNTAFRDLTHRYLFKPFTKRLAPRGGLGVGFLMSGLVHDAVISVPANGGYGGPTLYFILQGLGLLFERQRFGRRIRGRLFTGIVLVTPAPLLFHPPFVERVMLPFFASISAA